jgi:hypothetical protein
MQSPPFAPLRADAVQREKKEILAFSREPANASKGAEKTWHEVIGTFFGGWCSKKQKVREIMLLLSTVFAAIESSSETTEENEIRKKSTAALLAF